jgi:AmmeMemoRadiSam system protein A
MTSAADRRTLLGIARTALTAFVARLPAVEPLPTGGLAARAGAFVTLHRDGALRGCIGQVEPTDAVALVVARCAVAAGSRDPRFAPVTAPELDDLSIELSILGPLMRLSSPAAVRIGCHGLVAQQGRCQGLLLPQVAAVHGWTAEVFAAQTCVKAGLAADAWRRGAVLWGFEAEVFAEE